VKRAGWGGRTREEKREGGVKWYRTVGQIGKLLLGLRKGMDKKKKKTGNILGDGRQKSEIGVSWSWGDGTPSQNWEGK